jgi:hypothetical protein
VSRRALRSIVAALALGTVASPVAAQSLFATRGLGIPLAPTDARAQALGGIGAGLFDLTTSLANPADVAGIARRGISATYQPISRSVDVGGETDDASATRFPLVNVLFPFRQRWVLSLAYGGFLDQSWAVETEGEQIFGTDTLLVRDRLESTGGISQIRLGLAYVLTETVALGAAVGLYTGEGQRTVSRTFPDSASGLQPFFDRSVTAYRAPALTLGARWHPVDAVRVSGAVTVAGKLKIEEDSTDAEREVDMPLQLVGGASVAIAPRLTATAGARWTGFSATGAAGGVDEGADDALELGGGLEWEGARVGQRTFPIRVGARYAQLPFRVNGEQPNEISGALGLGARLALTDAGPLALVDATVERGRRGDLETHGLEESFWRLSLSLTLFGR